MELMSRLFDDDFTWTKGDVDGLPDKFAELRTQSKKLYNMFAYKCSVETAISKKCMNDGEVTPDAAIARMIEEHVGGLEEPVSVEEQNRVALLNSHLELTTLLGKNLKRLFEKARKQTLAKSMCWARWRQARVLQTTPSVAVS
jgi:hypothetical protein